MDALIRDWLCLIRAPGIGPARARPLLQKFGGPAQIRAASDSQLADCAVSVAARKYLHSEHPEREQLDWEWLQQPGAGFIHCQQAGFPHRLNAVDNAPIALFTLGDQDLLQYPQLAIIGSRNPSQQGLELAESFAAEMASRGLSIVSGMALGVDGAAHKGALAANGMTVAVCGTGLDKVYPARHHGLAQSIASNGLLVSEFAPGTPAKQGHFPRRNLTIAGLSLGVLVVEAARQSGSLITARMAMEQGREVFAIPGSLHNPLARGCHWLIRQGAKLVETADDVLEELSPQLADAVPQKALINSDDIKVNAANSDTPKTAEDHDYKGLLAHMAAAPTTVDKLVRCSGLTTQEVCSMLLILELDGFIESRPGGTYQRCS